MKKCNITIIILYAVAALCGIFFIYEYNTAQTEIAEYTSISSQHTTEMEWVSDIQHTDEPLPYQIIDFDALLEINADTVGWLSIPNGEINYPVVQAHSNSKYLGTSFMGEKSKTGAVFMDASNNTHPLDKNTVLYAHHINGRSDMFASLLEYKEKEYYSEHQLLQFDTVWKQYGWWRVFAVINLDVKKSSFNYLQLEFESTADFMAWVDSAKELSLYDTGMDVGPEDKVLTLSTCDRTNYGRNGRQIVLAVWEGELID